MSVKSAVSPPIVTDRERYERRLFERAGRRVLPQRPVAGIPMGAEASLGADDAIGRSLAGLGDPRGRMWCRGGCTVSARAVRVLLGHRPMPETCRGRASCHGADAGSIRFSAANIEDFDPQRSFGHRLVRRRPAPHRKLEAVLRCAARLLKPGGRLVVNEPQAENPFLGFLRGIRKRIDPAYSAHQVEFHPWALRGIRATAWRTSAPVPRGSSPTPFAEVPMKPSWLFVPAVALSCFLDRLAERVLGSLLLRITWNVIVYGRRLPEASQAADTGSAMREPCPSEQREVRACAPRPAHTNPRYSPVPIVLQHGTSPALS